jgi:hypothetical protein
MKGPVPLALRCAKFSSCVLMSLGEVELFFSAHNAQLGQLVEQHRVGVLGEDVDGVGVHLDHAVDALRIDTEVRRLRHGALDREHGVIGREGRAVVKLYAGAQVQTQLRRRELLPGRRQNGLGLESLAVVVHQRLVHRGMHTVGQRVVL